MNAKHTPGPWDFGFDETSPSGEDLYHVRHRGQAICSGALRVDAQLIAAAPDLVAALRACVDEFTSHGITEDACGDSDIDGGPTKSVLRAARAALAKAEV